MTVQRLRMIELCAGYGGLHLAAAQAGLPVDLAWYAEIDPDAAKVMATRHPGVPNLGDITARPWSTAPAGTVDLLAAGYPCQSFSNAGLRKGWDDERAIWPYVADAIRHLRPRHVFLENVASHVVRGFPRVLGDLSALGYDSQWTCVRASDVGAPHQRDRLFVYAHPGAAADTDGGTVWQQLVDGGARRAAPVAGGDSAGALMPTPGHRLGEAGRGQPGPELAAARIASGRRNLDDAVALLPTPAARDARRGLGWGDQPGRPLSETVARLMPTPRATDGTKGGPNQRGSSGDLMLPSAVTKMLPTPTVADSRNSRNATADRAVPPGPDTNHSSWTLCDVAHAGRWGEYGTAIARWETVVGRPAPEPTVTGPKGGQRLSPYFVEWMMGLPAGYVTDLILPAADPRPDRISRNAALRVLGNGVVPQQGASALRWLLTAAGTR